jgi:outer membrane protein OmpA-like peptidoglycan-associated protein
MPGNPGAEGAITVVPKEGPALVLDKPNAAAVSNGRRVESAALDEKALKEQFGDVLAARPPAARSFVLYFLEGSDELTPESQAEVTQVFAEIRGRQAPDIVVVGHTDRVGKLEDNDVLSKRRADKVRADLIRQGVAAESIQSAGRGEREPLVPTADEVKEARNRRVEIFVR